MMPHSPPCCPHSLLGTPNRTLSACPSFDKHLSSSNLDPESAHHHRLLPASLHSPGGLFSPYFRLLWLPLNLLLVSLPFMYLHLPFRKTYSSLSYAKTNAINCTLTQTVVSYLNVSPLQAHMSAKDLTDGVWRYAR